MWSRTFVFILDFLSEHLFRSFNKCLFHRSDYEEMPLQNGQAIRAKYKEESDSD